MDDNKQRKCLAEVLLCDKCKSEPWPFHKVCDKVPLKNITKVWDPVLSYFFSKVKLYADVLKKLESGKFNLNSVEKAAFEFIKKYYQEKIFFNQKLIRLMGEIISKLERL